MSELPPGIEPAEPPTPRESATGIVLRLQDRRWEVLMGLRSRNARFMPGHWAFPGGGVEPEDASVLARTASREVHEECGLNIGEEHWVDVGERVTPPMFPVRFRNRFFVAECADGWQPPPTPPSPEEIEALRFIEAAELLEQWSAGAARVPPPMIPLLRTIASAPPELGSAAEAIRDSNAQEERAPRIEFVPGIWMLPVRTRTLPPATHTNVWMPGVDRFVLIDPGCTEVDEIERLLEVVQRRVDHGAPCHGIVLTHEHQDHISGVTDVAQALKLPVFGHERALDRLVERVDGARDLDLRPLGEADRLELGGDASLDVLYTPGHSAGHLALHMAARKLLIAGDLVSGMSTILVHPLEGDMGRYLASLRRVDALGCRALLPAHGAPIPGKALPKLIAHREDRERKIAGLLAPDARSLRQVAAEAYAETPGLPELLVQGQTLAHLFHLEKQGKARRATDDAMQWAVAGEA